MGNLRSVQKALESIGADVDVVSTPEALKEADRIVFPGVGSFAECSRRMQTLGFREAVRESVLTDGKPLLGICLGMQGLVDSGDEGGISAGLGLIPGVVKKFETTEIGDLKIPHIGWNEVNPTQNHPLFEGLTSGDCFYFVHSYFVLAPDATVSTTEYGVSFASAIAHANVFGIQCHPEKSQVPGLRLLANFQKWKP